MDMITIKNESMINGIINDCNKKWNINGIFMDDNQLMD